MKRASFFSLDPPALDLVKVPNFPGSVHLLREEMHRIFRFRSGNRNIDAETIDRLSVGIIISNRGCTSGKTVNRSVLFIPLLCFLYELGLCQVCIRALRGKIRICLAVLLILDITVIIVYQILTPINGTRCLLIRLRDNRVRCPGT